MSIFTTIAMSTQVESRPQITYKIDGTSLVLEITLGIDLPIPLASLRSCIAGAAAIARSHEPNALTPDTPFRFQQPQDSKDSEASFGIVGNTAVDLSLNESTWGDFLEVLGALWRFIAEREERGEQGVALWFRLEDDGGERELEQIADGQLTGRTEWWTSDINSH